MDQLITSMLKERKSRVLGLRLLICYLKKSYIKLGGNEHIWVSLIFQSCNLSELRMYGDLIFSAMVRRYAVDKEGIIPFGTLKEFAIDLPNMKDV
ncbi:hypothetical protein M5D96_011414, partial [Drosophila gunungcola]